MQGGLACMPLSSINQISLTSKKRSALKMVPSHLPEGRKGTKSPSVLRSAEGPLNCQLSGESMIVTF